MILLKRKCSPFYGEYAILCHQDKADNIQISGSEHKGNREYFMKIQVGPFLIMLGHKNLKELYSTLHAVFGNDENA